MGPSSPNDRQISSSRGTSESCRPARCNNSLASGNVCSSFFFFFFSPTWTSLKWALLGRLPDWNISPQESHRRPQLPRLRPQLGTSARRSVISWSNPRRAVPIHSLRIHLWNFLFKKKKIYFVEVFSIRMSCWAPNHKWRYAQTGSALIPLSGTMLRLVGGWKLHILLWGHHGIVFFFFPLFHFLSG